MARIRSVHPGLFTDEAWVSCSQAARLLVIGLWTEADDQGVFEWKPLQLKMRLMPVDNVDVGALLDEIRRNGLVMGFEAGGKHYGAIRNFCRFQRPKKPKAWHPLPDIAREFVGVGATQEGEDDSEEAAVPKKSELSTPQVGEVPKKSELRPQMEDGGGKGEELEASLPAEAPASPEVEPEEKSPAWSKDKAFSEAWDTATPEMRKRSKNREKTWPQWKLAVRAAGGADKLLTAVRRYVREDADVKRTGGPGFDRWLRDGKWEPWTSGTSPPSAVVVAFDPAEQARRIALIESMSA